MREFWTKKLGLANMCHNIEGVGIHKCCINEVRLMKLIILSQLEDQGWHLEILWLVVHTKKGEGSVYMILIIHSCYVYRLRIDPHFKGCNCTLLSVE